MTHGDRRTWIVRAAAFLRDVLVAVFWCTLGAPVGYWAFLVLYAVHMGSLPRLDEFWPPPVLFFFGAVAGGFLGTARRACRAEIRQTPWAIRFFIAGIVAAPVMLLALAAYAMSGRPY